jgi:phage gpG-like protein
MPNYFELKFTVEGVPELHRVLGLTSRKVSNFKVPLTKASGFILSDVQTNFETEGALSGGWQPLTAGTIAGRIRAGFGASPILQRTGALRKSFYSFVDEKKALVSSRSPYFAYHQSRMPRTKIPRRAMLILTENTKQNIVEVFNKFLAFK